MQLRTAKTSQQERDWMQAMSKSSLRSRTGLITNFWQQRPGLGLWWSIESSMTGSMVLMAKVKFDTSHLATGFLLGKDLHTFGSWPRLLSCSTPRWISGTWLVQSSEMSHFGTSASSWMHRCKLWCFSCSQVSVPMKWAILLKGFRTNLLQRRNPRALTPWGRSTSLSLSLWLILWKQRTAGTFSRTSGSNTTSCSAGWTDPNLEGKSS